MAEALLNATDIGTTGGGAALPAGFPPVARYRFEFRALDRIRLPAYAGSAWRGLLGHGLRRAVCVTGQPRCGGCLLSGCCVYSALFESPATEGEARRRYTAVPHPFVLVLERSGPNCFAEGETVSLGLNLVGAANDAVPYLIHALALAGQQGVGAERGRFRVAAVHQERYLGEDLWEEVYDSDSGSFQGLAVQPPDIPPAPDRIYVELLTPLRIKRDGRFVGPREFLVGDLLYHLAWRLSALQAFHGEGAAVLPETRAEIAEHDGLLVARELRWYDWTRYSSRQRTRMQMGGLVGHMILDGRLAGRYWAQLWLGQWCHVGKATSMGLGQYRLG